MLLKICNFTNGCQKSGCEKIMQTKGDEYKQFLTIFSLQCTELAQNRSGNAKTEGLNREQKKDD